MIACVFDLVQDVAVLRPLVRFVRRSLDAPSLLLVSDKFLERDGDGTWRAELAALAAETSSDLHRFDTPLAAVLRLAGGRGLLIAGAESSLSGHSTTHDLFRAAPPGWLRVTLQHGFECVGFLHNAAHDRSHGTRVRFAADVICGWFAADRLVSVTPSERPKLFVTGPSLLLDAPPPRAPHAARACMVCENLHSVRLRVGGARDEFIATFTDIATSLGAQDGRVLLRPHPGGQFSLKEGLTWPEAVDISTRPLFREDLRDIGWAVSPPSSILFDLVLAGIPVGVWRDAAGFVDAVAYGGLRQVGSAASWLALRAEALADSGAILDQQAAFLRDLGVPEDVPARFAQLLAAG